MAWYRCVGGAGGSLKLRTASGSIATFSTNMVEAFKSLKSEINPVQDLHGYSKPWIGGGGKNRADKANDLPSGSGITITVANDCTLTINGTSTEVCYIRGYFNCPDSAATYTWALFNNKAFESGVEFSVRASDNSSAGGWARVNGTNKTFSFTPSAEPTKWQFQISSGITFNNAVFKPMIVSGNTAPTDYEPYSNICPISGFSGATIVRCGVNLLQKSFDYFSSVPDNVSSCFYIKAGTYTFSFASSTATNWRIGIKCKDLSGNDLSDNAHKPEQYLTWNTANKMWLQGSNNTNKTITVNFVDDCYIRFVFALGDTSASSTFADAILNVGSSASTYEPYNGQTAIVNFGQTVYGGVADVTNGKVTITHIKITDFAQYYRDFFSGTYSTEYRITLPYPSTNVVYSVKRGSLCNCKNEESAYWGGNHTAEANSANDIFAINPLGEILAIYDADTTLTKEQFEAKYSGNIEFVYELATPIEITTTPENLTAIVGQNNVYADTNGDTEVKYLYRE